MKITQVSTFDIEGGAGRAAYRLHRGLIALGQQSTMLSLNVASTDGTVRRIEAAPEPDEDERRQWLRRMQREYIDANRTRLSNTLFTLPYPGYDLNAVRDVVAADTINLHWVARLQSPITIRRLLELGKPVVWTLHDMWAFTGGCHYSAGCEGYRAECASCPQLAQDPYRLPAAVLSDRAGALAHPGLVVVTPSEWLASCVRRSRVFRHTRVERIPYSLDIGTFAPVPKGEAKRQLGIGPDTLTLLAGAHDGNERRKGFAELVEALRICAGDAGFQERRLREGVKLLWFGIPPESLGGLGSLAVELGQITSDERLRLIYSAADIYVLPSREDNLPNTMLEAMACGTPVVALDVGGIPEVVEDGVTGRLVVAGDVTGMARAILQCLQDNEARRKMSDACRRVIESRHGMPMEARRYLDLYQELLRTLPVSVPARSAAQEPGGRQCATPDVAQRPAPDVAEAAPPPMTADPGETGSALAVAVDCSLGPATEAVLHRWGFAAAQADLREARTHAARLGAELGRAQVSARATDGALAHVQADRDASREELEALRSRIEERTRQGKEHAQLEEARAEAALLRGRIAAMESSKFWRLRASWFRVKRALGLAAEE